MREIKFIYTIVRENGFVFNSESMTLEDIELKLAANFLTNNIVRTCDKIHRRQFTGLPDKNGKEIYEGDILRWRTIQTEYQTHYGDNIPNGAYTEPCGVTSKIRQEPVVYDNCGFTVFPKENEEQESACPIRYGLYCDREQLKYTLFPGLHGNKVSEEEFADYVKEICAELKMDFSTIDQFINDLMEFEVIGNIHENSELLK